MPVSFDQSLLMWELLDFYFYPIEIDVVVEAFHFVEVNLTLCLSTAVVLLLWALYTVIKNGIISTYAEACEILQNFICNVK